MRVKVETVVLGMTAYVKFYLNKKTGRLLSDNIKWNMQTKQSRMECNKYVQKHPENYIEMPRINFTPIFKEFFESHIFSVADLERYSIPDDIDFCVYVTDYRDQRRFLYNDKMYHLFEYCGLKDEFIEYRDKRKEEIARHWCEEQGIRIVD